MLDWDKVGSIWGQRAGTQTWKLRNNIWSTGCFWLAKKRERADIHCTCLAFYLNPNTVSDHSKKEERKDQTCRGWVHVLILCLPSLGAREETSWGLPSFWMQYLSLSGREKHACFGWLFWDFYIFMWERKRDREKRHGRMWWRFWYFDILSWEKKKDIRFLNGCFGTLIYFWERERETERADIRWSDTSFDLWLFWEEEKREKRHGGYETVF